MSVLLPPRSEARTLTVRPPTGLDVPRLTEVDPLVREAAASTLAWLAEAVRDDTRSGFPDGTRAAFEQAIDPLLAILDDETGEDRFEWTTPFALDHPTRTFWGAVDGGVSRRTENRCQAAFAVALLADWLPDPVATHADLIIDAVAATIRDDGKIVGSAAIRSLEQLIVADIVSSPDVLPITPLVDHVLLETDQTRADATSAIQSIVRAGLVTPTAITKTLLYRCLQRSVSPRDVFTPVESAATRPMASILRDAIKSGNVESPLGRSELREILLTEYASQATKLDIVDVLAAAEVSSNGSWILE